MDNQKGVVRHKPHLECAEPTTVHTLGAAGVSEGWGAKTSPQVQNTKPPVTDNSHIPKLIYTATRVRLRVMMGFKRLDQKNTNGGLDKNPLYKKLAELQNGKKLLPQRTRQNINKNPQGEGGKPRLLEAAKHCQKHVSPVKGNRTMYKKIQNNHKTQFINYKTNSFLDSTTESIWSSWLLAMETRAIGQKDKTTVTRATWVCSCNRREMRKTSRHKVNDGIRPTIRICISFMATLFFKAKGMKK